MLSKSLFARAVLLKNLPNVKQPLRNGSHGVWSYRIPPPLPSRKSVLLAQGLGGLCWWWILYHIATEPEHIYGEFPYVPPSTWSNEELGIPPDSQGSLM